MCAAVSPPILLVLAGPAGSGKTTLCGRLVAAEPRFARVVTATTRPPRAGETDGQDYHFLTAEQFDTKIAAGEFLEWAWVHQKHRYGTLAGAVLGPLATGRSLVINVDVQGVDHFRRAAVTSPVLARALVTVFITVPMTELRARLASRGESPAEIERRMATAGRELREIGKFDRVIQSRTREEDFTALQAILGERVAGR
ncbi:MAG: guanylate kinase [Verrucomicrobiota bacterium]